MRIFLKNVTDRLFAYHFLCFQHNGVEIILFGVSGSAKHALPVSTIGKQRLIMSANCFGCVYVPGGVVVAFPDDLCFYIVIAVDEFLSRNCRHNH